MNKPYLAVSELTNTIYIVDGKEKYDVTEQALNAIRLTHRAIPTEKLEQIRAEIAYAMDNTEPAWKGQDNYEGGLAIALSIIDKAIKEVSK